MGIEKGNVTAGGSLGGLLSCAAVLQVYISTMESKLYPFTATQWHPEKNAFEWGDKLHIPHSRGAVEVTHAGKTLFSSHRVCHTADWPHNQQGYP